MAMKKNEHYFEYVWPNPPRTTTKVQWKAVSRWIRVCQRHLLGKIDIIKIGIITDKILGVTSHEHIYGKGVYE